MLFSDVDLSLQTYKFGWDYAAITLGTMAAYTWFTVKTTSWRFVFLLKWPFANLED